jgi:hypothetical protein
MAIFGFGEIREIQCTRLIVVVRLSMSVKNSQHCCQHLSSKENERSVINCKKKNGVHEGIYGMSSSILSSQPGHRRGRLLHRPDLHYPGGAARDRDCPRREEARGQPAVVHACLPLR